MLWQELRKAEEANAKTRQRLASKADPAQPEQQARWRGLVEKSARLAEQAKVLKDKSGETAGASAPGSARLQRDLAAGRKPYLA